MERNSQIPGLVIGAIGGAMIGYLLFTPQGRRAIQSLRGMLEDLAREAHQATAIVEDLVGEAERWPPIVGKVRTAFSRGEGRNDDSASSSERFGRSSAARERL